MKLNDKNVLTLKDVSDYTGFKISYLYKLTSSGILPHSKPNGKTIFVDKEKLETWMLSNPSTSFSDKQILASSYITSKSNKNSKP
jgi:excisionase family DNA binding protein